MLDEKQIIKLLREKLTEMRYYLMHASANGSLLLTSNMMESRVDTYSMIFAHMILSCSFILEFSNAILYCYFILLPD